MKKWFLIAAIIIGAAVLVIILFRVFSPEDTWIKDANGNWIKHGNPSTKLGTSPAGSPPNN